MKIQQIQSDSPAEFSNAKKNGALCCKWLDCKNYILSLLLHETPKPEI